MQPIAHHGGLLAKALDEGRQRLGMRQVQPALARQQELAAGRGHGVVDVDFDPGGRQHLGRHQACGAGAEDGGKGRLEQGHEGWRMGEKQKLSQMLAQALNDCCNLWQPGAAQCIGRPSRLLAPDIA